jgi:multidrug efflux pump subunit AcrA (membrane-fusion protein)
MNWSARRWLWTVGVVVPVLFLVWLFLPSEGSQSLRWEEVRQGDLVVELVESGEVRAVNAQNVTAPLEWRADLQIIDMVPEGSMVEKGDFLVQLDTGFLERELEDTQSQLESDLAELRRLMAEQKSRRQALQNSLTTAQLAREQAELQLQKLRFESEARREEARLALQKAIINLEKARAKLNAQRILDSLETLKVKLKIEKGRGRVEKVQRRIEGLTLRAPLSGLVVYYEGRRGNRRKPRVGDKVSPGRTILQIPDLSLMEVVFPVHEVDREKLREGLPVKVTLEAFPERTFEATISSIAQLAERRAEKSEVKEFEVHATIDGTDAMLKPGMTAQVRVQLATYPNETLVPLTTVFEKDGVPIVFPKRSWPKPTSVELGPRDDVYAVVTGVEPGSALSTVPPPEAEGVQPLGYADYERYLEMREQEFQRHFEELQRRGITFDYTTFRKEGKAGLRATSKGESETTAEGGMIVLPDGRKIQLPPGAMQRMRRGGKTTLRLQVPVGDTARVQPPRGELRTARGERQSRRAQGAALADSMNSRGQKP